MINIYIATSRPTGILCREWALENIPNEYSLVDTIESADIVISVLYEKLFTYQEIQGKRCYNFHPGILPDYRGSGAYSWAIINEEKEFGITLHLIDEGIDTGDIIETERFPIHPGDTSHTLHLRGTKVTINMFKNFFIKILENKITTSPQNNQEGMIYYRKDLQKAKDLTKYLRAFSFPGKEAAYYVNSLGNKVYLEL
jgi:methionyl-tRNA formyltransferase